MFGKFFSGLLSAILTAVLIFTGQYLNDQMARVLSPPSPAPSAQASCWPRSPPPSGAMKPS